MTWAQPPWPRPGMSMFQYLMAIECGLTPEQAASLADPGPGGDEARDLIRERWSDEH